MTGCLHKRGGSDNWYVRVHVPSESQAIIGKKEIWRSLGTADRRLAQKLAPACVAEILQEIELALLKAPRTATLGELENVVRRFYEGEVASDAEERTYDIESVRERLH